MDQLRSEGTLLPLVNMDRNHLGSLSEAMVETPVSIASRQVWGSVNGHVVNGEEKKDDAAGPGRPRARSRADGWMMLGTRQEETWRGRDGGAGVVT